METENLGLLGLNKKASSFNSKMLFHNFYLGLLVTVTTVTFKQIWKYITYFVSICSEQKYVKAQA